MCQSRRRKVILILVNIGLFYAFSLHMFCFFFWDCNAHNASLNLESGETVVVVLI